MAMFGQIRFGEGVYRRPPGEIVAEFTYPEVFGYKLKFYDTSGQKIGELGSDIEDNPVSFLKFELLDNGCGEIELGIIGDLAFAITYRTRVDVHLFFRKDPIYSGYIKELPKSGDTRAEKIYRGYGYVEQLKWCVIDKEYTIKQDVAEVVRDIAQTVESKTDIVYASWLIYPTYYNINNLKFDKVPAYKALEDCAAIAQNFEFGVDAQRRLYFRPKDQAVYFWKWQGKHIQDFEISEDASELANKLYVKGGEIDTVNKTNYRLTVEDATSQATYGLREKVITAPNIKSDVDLQRWAEWKLSELKDPKVKASLKNVILTVPDDIIEVRGKVKITAIDGTEYELPIKKVVYDITSAGMKANVTLGALEIPIEDTIIDILRQIEAERILGDRRVEQLA